MTDHRDGVGARLPVFPGAECPPQEGRYTAGTEKIPGHELALDGPADTLAIPAHEGCLGIESGEPDKGLIVIAQVEVARVTQTLIPVQGGAALELLPPNLPQLPRSIDRRRAQHQGVDKAEYGCVGGDAERQRDDGDGAEAGVLQDLPEGELEIAHGSLNR